MLQPLLLSVIDSRIHQHWPEKGLPDAASQDARGVVSPAGRGWDRLRDWHGARSGSSWKIKVQKVQSTRTQFIHVYPLLLENSVVGKLFKIHDLFLAPSLPSHGIRMEAAFWLKYLKHEYGPHEQSNNAGQGRSFTKLTMFWYVLLTSHTEKGEAVDEAPSVRRILSDLNLDYGPTDAHRNSKVSFQSPVTVAMSVEFPLSLGWPLPYIATSRSPGSDNDPTNTIPEPQEPQEPHQEDAEDNLKQALSGRRTVVVNRGVVIHHCDSLRVTLIWMRRNQIWSSRH